MFSMSCNHVRNCRSNVAGSARCVVSSDSSSHCVRRDCHDRIFRPRHASAYRTAVRSEDTLKAAAAKFRAMYFTEDLDAGIHESQALATQFPDATDIRTWLVLMLGRNNHSEDALKEVEALNAAYPNDPWSAFALVGTLNYAGGSARRGSTRALAPVFFVKSYCTKFSCHGVWVFTMALRMRISLCIQAVSATFFSFPVARNRA